MTASRAGAALVLCLQLIVPAGAVGQEQPTEAVGLYEEVQLQPAGGSALEWGDRRYAGRLEVRSTADGLVVVERVGPEDYLLGIQEVPFSWPEETLKAQAVAARTYLAWTLRRGRAGSGARYGFDICASPLCQVYGGLDQVQGPDGERWASAVTSTAGEILVYAGAPAQALYSSTTGGRTRDVRDVFGGSGVPYLRAVPSPDEPSPFAEWSYEMPGPVLAAILREAGEIEGGLTGVEVQTTEDGSGAWVVEVAADGRRQTFTTWQFRGILNRYGPEVAPDLLPATRPDGRRYPQTVLSPTYQVSRTWDYPEEFRSGFIVVEEVYTVSGNGWGHLVGLSQYGALAMAERGSDYSEILAHYYGGLRPEDAGAMLPGEIVVGLSWGQAEVVVTAGGPLSVAADGEPLADEALGTWRFEARADDIAVYPPAGFGLPPALRDIDPARVAPAGSSVVVTGTLAAAAEVRIVVFRGPAVISVGPWTVREAGRIALVWDGSHAGEVAGPGRYRVLIEARSPEGTADAFSTIDLVKVTSRTAD